MINNNQLTYKNLVSESANRTISEIKKSKSANSVNNLAKDLYEQAETIINQEYQKIDPKLDCRKGCSFCCYNQVSATPVEIIAIADYLKSTLNKEELNTLKDKINEVDKITSNINHLERKKLKQPCVFLKDNVCSIYPVRPLSCRGWNSTNVNDCEKAFNSDGEVNINIFGPQLMTTNSVSTGINQGLNNLGYKPENLELISAVKIALSKYNVAEKYLSGQNIFRDARLNY